jgi:hypothetical protein
LAPLTLFVVVIIARSEVAELHWLSPWQALSRASGQYRAKGGNRRDKEVSGSRQHHKLVRHVERRSPVAGCRLPAG